MNTSDQNQYILPDAPDPRDKCLQELYRAHGIAVDRLPYTDDFNNLVSEFAKQFEEHDDDQLKREIFHRLLRMRKQGELPRTRASAESVETDNAGRAVGF